MLAEAALKRQNSPTNPIEGLLLWGVNRYQERVGQLGLTPSSSSEVKQALITNGITGGIIAYLEVCRASAEKAIAKFEQKHHLSMTSGLREIAILARAATFIPEGPLATVAIICLPDQLAKLVASAETWADVQERGANGVFN